MSELEFITTMEMPKWTEGKKNPDGTEIPSWLPTKEYIGLQGKHRETNIYFRNLTIPKL